MANNEAAVLAERLRAAAAAAGAHLVEGHVRTGSASHIPEVYLETDAALALISVAKPRVIYVDETMLEFEDLLVEARELLRLGENDDTPAALGIDLEPLAAGVVHQDQRDPGVRCQVAQADVLAVAAEVGEGQRLGVDDLQESGRAPRCWT